MGRKIVAINPELSTLFQERFGGVCASHEFRPVQGRRNTIESFPLVNGCAENIQKLQKSPRNAAILQPSDKKYTTNQAVKFIVGSTSTRGSILVSGDSIGLARGLFSDAGQNPIAVSG